MGDMFIPIAIVVVVILIIIVLIAMAITNKKSKKEISLGTPVNNPVMPKAQTPVNNNQVLKPITPVEQKEQVVTREVQQQSAPEVRSVVNEAENVLDDIQNIIGDHKVTTNTIDTKDEKGRPKRIVENTKIDIDLTDEKAKEDVILKLKTPSQKKTPYKVKPPVVKDTPGEHAEVTINEAVEEQDEPKYDKIPKYVDPKTIKENGVDAEVTEGIALEEDKKSEIDVFDDTHKEENKPLTNEEGEQVEEVKSVPLHEEYEYDPEDDEIEETKEEEKAPTNYEVDENYSKTEILDVSEINQEMERRRIAEISDEEIFRYIQEMQDALIDEAENYIEEMKSKVR